jgi:epoxyqueuosine reductase
VDPTSNPMPFRDRLSQMARDAGFDLAGIVPVPEFEEPADGYFERWIDAGYAGDMEYLKRRNEDDQLLRSSLQTAFPWARSVIVCAKNYNTDAPRSIDDAPEGSGWIARYAWTGTADAGGRIVPSDYHDVLLKRLRLLEERLKDWLGPIESRSYVDTGPIVERAYAHAAGIGWTGKNTCILNQELGSWLFLGVIVTSYEVPWEKLPESMALPPPDRCGSCRRCIEACPTEALIAPYEMDASRCIAYLTIEKRGPIPEALQLRMGRQVFGCDICQDVCPWNRRAPVTSDADLVCRRELVNPALSSLAELEPKSFNQLFKGSPVKRTKLGGLQRSLAIAMGNTGLPEYLPRLEEWRASNDPVLSEAASRAIEKIDDRSE